MIILGFIKILLFHIGNFDESFVNETPSCNLPLCEVSFVGVFPSMKIVDIQGEGIASQISKATLWKMLSIGK